MTDYTDRETEIRDAKERRAKVRRIDGLAGMLLFGSMLASGCASLAGIAALVLWMTAPVHVDTAVSVALWMATMMILLIALAVIVSTVGRVVARKGGLW